MTSSATFTFRAHLVIVPILFVVGAGSLVGGLKDLGRGSPPVMMFVISAGALFWAWHHLWHAPRRLTVGDEGFALRRGFRTAFVPWSLVERVDYGRPDGARHGVYVSWRGGAFGVLSANAGKRTTQAIADQMRRAIPCGASSPSAPVSGRP